MQVLLRIANGKSNVRKVRIQSDTVIGRSPECQLKVASNQISRRHCQIVIRDTVVAIKDLGSANGTFVNGRQVPPEVEIPLTPGTRVMLGPLQFTVEYELPGMPPIVVVPAIVPPNLGEAPPLEDVGNLTEVVTTPPQLQGETAPGGKSQGSTPVPGNVVAPQQFPPPNYQPQNLPPAGVPVAFSGSLPASNPPHVPAAIPQAPWPTPVLPPGVVPMPAAGLPAGNVAGVPVHAMPSGALPTVGPQSSTPAPPDIEQSMVSGDQSSGGFHFGIFAASGSGVIVESAAEIPMMTIPRMSPPVAPEPPKPPKKGLLQMFGWGKKKLTAPEPHVTRDIVTEVEIPARPEPAHSDEVTEDSDEADAANSLSFDVPTAEDEAPTAPEVSPDESLQNFFDNFK